MDTTTLKKSEKKNYLKASTNGETVVTDLVPYVLTLPGLAAQRIRTPLLLDERGGGEFVCCD